jgi:AraC-like DNA-binding protein
MEDNYSNSEFGVEELSRALGISRSVLSKQIAAETGESTSQFMRNYRLDVAKDILLKNPGNRNIAEIAFKVGFNDPKYFTRCFTKLYGVSPSAVQ